MPREYHRSRRRANRTRRVKAGEPCPLPRELVEVRRLDHKVPRAAHGVPVLLVSHDKEQIDLRRIGGLDDCQSRQQGEAGCQECRAFDYLDFRACFLVAAGTAANAFLP